MSLVNGIEKQQKRLFVICDNCFWCASAINTHQFEVNSCPECNNPVSLLPIANNEEYRYNYTVSRGVELEFYLMH
jgi:hypothetical protein